MLSTFTKDSPFDRWLSHNEICLPPEVERDNIEYKVQQTAAN
jgi:hypothetical protein